MTSSRISPTVTAKRRSTVASACARTAGIVQASAVGLLAGDVTDGGPGPVPGTDRGREVAQ